MLNLSLFLRNGKDIQIYFDQEPGGISCEIPDYFFFVKDRTGDFVYVLEINGCHFSLGRS